MLLLAPFVLLVAAVTGHSMKLLWQNRYMPELGIVWHPVLMVVSTNAMLSVAAALAFPHLVTGWMMFPAGMAALLATVLPMYTAVWQVRLQRQHAVMRQVWIEASDGNALSDVLTMLHEHWSNLRYSCSDARQSIVALITAAVGLVVLAPLLRNALYGDLGVLMTLLLMTVVQSLVALRLVRLGGNGSVSTIVCNLVHAAFLLLWLCIVSQLTLVLYFLSPGTGAADLTAALRC